MVIGVKPYQHIIMKARQNVYIVVFINWMGWWMLKVNHVFMKKMEFVVKSYQLIISMGKLEVYIVVNISWMGW